MNERIKELAEQATQKFSRFGERDSWEKLFAELIVRECANLHFRGIDEISAETEYKICKMIQEHFGVEE